MQSSLYTSEGACAQSIIGSALASAAMLGVHSFQYDAETYSNCVLPRTCVVRAQYNGASHVVMDVHAQQQDKCCSPGQPEVLPVAFLPPGSSSLADQMSNITPAVVIVHPAPTNLAASCCLKLRRRVRRDYAIRPALKRSSWLKAQAVPLAERQGVKGHGGQEGPNVVPLLLQSLTTAFVRYVSMLHMF